MKPANDNRPAMLVQLSTEELATMIRDAVREALAATPAPIQAAMLSAEDAARMLSVTPAHVRNLLRRGELEGVRVGNAWRVRRSDVEALMRGGRDAA